MDDEMTMMTRLPCLYFQIQIKIWRKTTPFKSEKKKILRKKDIEQSIGSFQSILDFDRSRSNAWPLYVFELLNPYNSLSCLTCLPV